MSAVMDNILNTPVDPASESSPMEAVTREHAKSRAAIVAKPSAAKRSFRPFVLAVLPPVFGLVLLVLV